MSSLAFRKKLCFEIERKIEPDGSSLWLLYFCGQSLHLVSTCYAIQEETHQGKQVGEIPSPCSFLLTYFFPMKGTGILYPHCYQYPRLSICINALEVKEFGGICGGCYCSFFFFLSMKRWSSGKPNPIYRAFGSQILLDPSFLVNGTIWSDPMSLSNLQW